MSFRRVLPLLMVLFILLTTAAVRAADDHVRANRPTSVSKPVSAGSTGTPVTTASTLQLAGPKPAASPKTAPIPNCRPGSIVKPPQVNLNTNQSGLIKTPQTKGFYTIFGTDLQQIGNQMYRCSPVMAGGKHYAASTDYAISWKFSILGDEQNICRLSDVRVGLAVSQTYPAWQPSTNASSHTTAQWNRFMTNLTNHEDGHSRLNNEYAQKLLSMLTSLPPTSCESISAVASAKAQSVITALDQANRHYDHVTGHGATQGAVLGRQ